MLHCKALRAGPRPCCRTLTDRVVDITPAFDGFDVTVNRSEVHAHRHDGNVASPGIAPRCNVARPLVFLPLAAATKMSGHFETVVFYPVPADPDAQTKPTL